MSNGSEIISLVSEHQDRDQFRRKNWVGTFEQYLDIVREDPQVTRTAYQRRDQGSRQGVPLPLLRRS